MMTKCDVCDEVNWFFQSQILWRGGKLELKTRPGWSFNEVAFNLDYISLFKEIMFIQFWKKDLVVQFLSYCIHLISFGSVYDQASHQESDHRQD